ncbi:ABC transporter [Hamiltosporidium magnivora]|uniref:ABC transporter n=1 Tax=Hamiltosporidium magnivora TaxID=148818 RepID=A0A4V2JWF2_9MICR|nr:ABC transporter [Hamiltosporidium magnivora]
MNFEWRNVDIELRNKNKNMAGSHVKLIKNANGVVSKGSLCAIMGPSGSGKTTLIKALAGRVSSGSRTKGEILADGHERSYRNWCKNVGYVDQDDCVYEQLSVLETITYAAKFRLKDKNVDIHQKVEQLLNELDIYDISGTRMCSVSGGERKRVMIAVELVTQPKILFMDEPTSGLDAHTALNLIYLIKKLSKSHNMSVIFTIHQPSAEIFSIFDTLVLLSDSNTVYFGEAKSAEDHFAKYGLKKRDLSSFPEFLADVLKVKKKYTESHENQAIMSQMINDNEKSCNKQFGAIISTKNAFIIDLKPSFKDIIILLHRRYKVSLSRKKIIFSIFIFTFFFYIFCKFVSALLDSTAVKDIITAIFNQYTFYISNTDIKNSIREVLSNIEEMKKVFSRPLAMNFLSFFFAYSMIASTGSFSQEYKMIMRELGVATFSITSYYLSVFLFEALCYLPMLFCSALFVFFKFGYTYIKWEFYLFFFGGMFCYLPTILFFGSLTKRTKTIYVLISFLALTWILPPTIYTGLYFTAVKYDLNSLHAFIYIVSLFPPLHYNTMCVAVAYKLSRKGVKLFETFPRLKECTDALEKFFTSYLFDSVKIWQMFSFFIVTTSVYTLLSFLFLGIRLMPDMRFKLSK